MAQGDYNYDDPNNDPNYNPDEMKDAANKESNGFQAPPSPEKAWTKGPADSTWLNWIHSAYGDSKTRGGGFADLTPGTSMNDVVSRFNTDTGSGARLVGGASGDMVDFGQGARDVKTAEGQLWYNYGPGGPPGGNPGGGGGGAAAGGSSAPAASAASNAAATAQAQMTAELQLKQQQDKALRDQLIGQLTQRAQQGLAVDRNDPTIRAQADAYSANEERSKRNYLADIAEKRGPLANLQGEERMAAEKVGQRTGGFEAELMGRELTAKRTEIAQALESMRGMLTTEQEMTLREKLAQMDDTLGRLKLQQDATQFNANLGFQDRSLTQQGTIANNNLGYNYDQLDWERSPLNPRNIIPAGG